ncbi:MAG: PepSY domain-containing protein [Gammaproteobacteria bacterium]|nr:PepSY domain-containing protein [Gammaproteobacteria bacterium]NNK24560.1 PepSY domain-containing protein [Woeseiaceae bacterium]
MRTNRSRVASNAHGRRWLRRAHRWAGTSLVVFVLFLATTGIVLNHAVDLGLDRKYLRWPWLLDAYGMRMPGSYAGTVAVGSFVVVGDGRSAHVLLESGELVESIDLGSILPGDIERVGRDGGRAVFESGGRLFRSDADVSQFQNWADGDPGGVEWSSEVDRDTAGLEVLQDAWRGRGVTVERVLLDLHSGRILAAPGRLLLDIVAVGMILLGVSGLFLTRLRRRNGS